MYTSSRKAGYRNRSTSFIQKKETNNTRTFSRIHAAQEKLKLQQKSTPLFISASSWIVITPNAFNHLKSTNAGFINNEKSSATENNSNRVRKTLVSSNLLGTDTEPIMHGLNYHKVREIASLTKIMTCFTILKLIEKYSLNKHATLITISKNASQIVGTSSRLQEGHVLSVWDLLHGLMLPSGNDAAIALAEFFGAFLLKKENRKLDSPLTNSKL